MSESSAFSVQRPCTPPPKHALVRDLNIMDTASSKSPRTQVAESLCSLHLAYHDDDMDDPTTQALMAGALHRPDPMHKQTKMNQHCIPSFNVQLHVQATDHELSSDQHYRESSSDPATTSSDSDEMQIDQPPQHDHRYAAAGLGISAITPPDTAASSAKSTPTKKRSRKRSQKSATPTKQKRRHKSPPPSYDRLSWHESELTRSQLSCPDDDGTGINGVGFKPTPAKAYARAQKRKQQVDAYRAREARDARQYRIEKRRGSSSNTISPYKQKLLNRRSEAIGQDFDSLEKFVRVRSRNKRFVRFE